MEKTESYLASIAESLKSIDESLKKIAGRPSEPQVIKKTYAQKYFRQSEDGEREAEALE